MTSSDHNKPMPKGPQVAWTLHDLRAFIAGCELSPQQKSLIRSAIKRADELVGHGVLDFPANPAMLMQRLAAVTPAIAGMSSGALANLRSRVRKAFALAEPHRIRRRRGHRLTGEWAALQSGLDTDAQRNLSRLFHYAEAMGWQPGEITNAHMERFTHHLREEAAIVQWEEVVRKSIRAWNRLAACGGHPDLQTLTPTPAKRTAYWVARDQWPEGLRSEVDAVLKRLGNPDLFAGRRVRKIAAATVQQYDHMITTLVSAMVRRGVALESLQSLTAALAPDHVSQALTFLAERGGGTITATMMQMMIRVRVLADMCGLASDQREELEAIWRNMERNAPPERQRRHMAGKNRVLLDRLEDDQRFADLIHTLPERLATEARARGPGPRTAPLMRTALAIDLLLTCSMRRENLVRLELGTSIRKIGTGSARKWVIELVAQEVKNAQPLRFVLEGPTVDLLEDYLADWRPLLSAAPNPWLLPGPDGQAIKPPTLALAIQTQSRRVLGVAISPHQFRHISAESFLLAHPDKLDLISDHLGHRDRNTTRNYYARSKQKQASRAYQEHALKIREDAAERLSRKPRAPKDADRRKD